MAKITLSFKDTKTGVDIAVDPASFKRVKRKGHKLSRAEELAVRMFVAIQQADGVLRGNELGGPVDELVPVRGKSCCGGSCDCKA